MPTKIKRFGWGNRLFTPLENNFLYQTPKEKSHFENKTVRLV